jgi:hypothetical protein
MTTTDIWFAAFIYRISPKTVGVPVRKDGKTTFHFDLSQEDWDKLKVSFIHSEESDIKYRMEKLKDLAYQ